MNAYLENLKIDYEIRKELITKRAYTGKVKQVLDEQIADHKRGYRNYLKKCNNTLYWSYPHRGEIVAGGGEYDSRWMKVFFPGEHWTHEEKEEFITDNWKRVRYAAYDCTGDTFTKRISVFNVPQGVVAYIFEGVDV